MAICVGISAKIKRVCIGALNKRIKIQLRTLTPPAQIDDVDYTETLTLIRTVWSYIETVSGEKQFDGTEIDTQTTHNFYIRYFENVVFGNWVEYKNQRFRVLSVENFNEQSRFFKIQATNRGVDTNEANLA